MNTNRNPSSSARMKMLRAWFCAILVFLFPPGYAGEDALASADPTSAKIAAIQIGDAAAGLDTNKRNALAIEKFWRRLSGEDVWWQGTIVEIKHLNQQIVLYLYCPGADTPYDYNVIAYLAPETDLEWLQVASELYFRGRVVRYTNHKGRPAVFILRNVLIFPDHLPEPLGPAAPNAE